MPVLRSKLSALSIISLDWQYLTYGSIGKTGILLSLNILTYDLAKSVSVPVNSIVLVIVQQQPSVISILTLLYNCLLQFVTGWNVSSKVPGLRRDGDVTVVGSKKHGIL